MTATVKINLNKKRVELQFDELPVKELVSYLKEIGFKESFSDDKHWYGDNHPAYINYAKGIEEVYAKGGDWKSLSLAPSFDANQSNINSNKFSLVIFILKSNDEDIEESFVLFDSYKKVATEIAKKYAQSKYGDSLKSIKVYPRNYKKQARVLLAQKKVITSNLKEESLNKEISFKPAKEINKEKPKSITNSKSISKDIMVYGNRVDNVLVPIHANEPFQSGGVSISDTNFLKFKFPELYEIQDSKLLNTPAIQLFQLMQLSHPNDYGMQIHRASMLDVWEKRGEVIFEEIGFPTDRDYPYVNIHTGYKSVSSLERKLNHLSYTPNWWAVASHDRPVADIDKGISIIKEKLLGFAYDREEYLNEKTGKPKTDKASKENLQRIDWEVQNYQESLSYLENYKENNDFEEIISLVENEEDMPVISEIIEDKKEDYLDRVIAIMHEHYAKGERLSKKKIEKLKETVGSPSLGALWEAVELSWLLWYKQLYNDSISFEKRLLKMVQFWDNIQPTYDYSDSSKELYKQYSTPCVIGAIIAEYTGMSWADMIFEPSAGNGLLVIGADPQKTHVNEIDSSRKKSLEYQKFGSITTWNASLPFSSSMDRVYDVVVTNPPFAKWEASEFDKMRLIQKYFGKHYILPRHLRLEHLMSAIALNSMHDGGRSAIILMGHIYYDERGLFAKYRPFFNWLYRHYYVDDIINMNSFKLYNKQGAVTRTMLILINGRKEIPEGISPHKPDAPQLEEIVETFQELWERVKLHIRPSIPTLIKQLKIEIK